VGWTHSTQLSLGPLIFIFTVMCIVRFELSNLPSVSTVIRKIFRFLGSVEARDRRSNGPFDRSDCKYDPSQAKHHHRGAAP
jgi:hypothetical protein